LENKIRESEVTLREERETYEKKKKERREKE